MKPAPDINFDDLLAEYLREMRLVDNDPMMIELIRSSYLAGAIAVRAAQAHVSTMPQEEWEPRVKLIDDQIAKATTVSIGNIGQLEQDALIANGEKPGAVH